MAKKPSDLVRARLPLLDYLNDSLNMGIAESSLPKSISCPLHTDNKPSLRLYNPKENGGYCFSCGKAYDSISMHSHLHGISYFEAMKQLAQDLNISLDITQLEPQDKDTKELVGLVKHNMQYIKTQPNLPENFDALARDIYRAIRTGDLNKLRYGSDDEF